MTKWFWGLSGAILLSGCVSERVVLLPSADGRPSAVVVRNAAGDTVLDQPYASVVRQAGAATTYVSSVEDVDKRYGKTLAAMPARPVSYLLYFEAGSDQLTEASRNDFIKLRQQIAGQPAAEVRIIGHTDRVGSVESNDQLSLQRARAVREALVGIGIAADKLEAVGRGEREPLVATADEVDEPRNRRVEIVVR